MSLSSAEAEIYALTTGIAEGMVTKHLLQELGHEVTLMRDAEIHVRARRSGEEVDESRIHQHEAEQSRFDDKVSHI